MIRNENYFISYLCSTKYQWVSKLYWEKSHQQKGKETYTKNEYPYTNNPTGIIVVHLLAFGKLESQKQWTVLLYAVMSAMFREESCDCSGKISYFSS